MGFPGQFGQGAEPEWLAAKEKFMSILDKHDKPYGGFAFPDPPFGSAEGFKQAAQRMSFITMGADVFQLSLMAGDLQKCKDIVDN